MPDWREGYQASYNDELRALTKARQQSTDEKVELRGKVRSVRDLSDEQIKEVARRTAETAANRAIRAYNAK